MEKETVILTCSSLERYVKRAQEKMHTNYPIIVIDRIYHVEPATMKTVIWQELEKRKRKPDTILAAMGFCGGVWDQVRAQVRTVIPRVDDCVSLLLATDDRYIPNRKESGHLYLYEDEPEKFSVLSLLKDYRKASKEFQGLDEETLFHMWFDQYYFLDMIHAALDYVQGSNRILEKLVSGEWDEQFLVAEPGHLIRHGDFF